MSNQRRTFEDIELGEEFLQCELRNQAGEVVQQGENRMMVACRPGC
jgi:hypothetical protein